MKHAVRSLLAAVLIASPALGQPAEKPNPDKPSAAQAAPKGSVIKIIDAGAEPRRALRYAPTKGDEFGFEMRIKMSMAMGMNGQKMPNTAMPEMVMVGGVNVLDAAPDGDVKLKLVYGRGRLEGTDGVMPMMVSAMKKVMDNMPGVTGEFVFTSRGDLVSGSFTFPEGIDPGTRQQLQQTGKSMEQMTLPLPAEPVGKGAKWTADKVIENNGVKVNAVYTQEVTDLSDNAFSVKVSLKGVADKESLPGGAKIESFTMSGGGEQHGPAPRHPHQRAIYQ